MNQVFTVGHKPPWIKNAHHIPFPDQWGYDFKDKNIIKKMLRACADGRVSDPFVANSDDQYWLRIIEPKEMLIPPREFPAQMEMDAKGRKLNLRRAFRNRWVKRQAETVHFLSQNKRCATCFDGHVPYLIEKEKYLLTMSQIPWEMGDGFLIVVYHGWNWESLANGSKIEDRDGVLVRIKADLKTEQIEEKTRNSLFLNHNNKALSIGMREFLKKKFPNPSRWE
ncbi:MAG: hypothetical protein MUP52_09560 [Candidatus Aminicenantes bacterium]|nr:hypothetical protein [Candidatus Aminicenantes bacterium]